VIASGTGPGFCLERGGREFGSPATAGQIASDLAFGRHDDTLSVLAKTPALTHPGARIRPLRFTHIHSRPTRP
jgi:hypothetical protein